MSTAPPLPHLRQARRARSGRVCAGTDTCPATSHWPHGALGSLPPHLGWAQSVRHIFTRKDSARPCDSCRGLNRGLGLSVRHLHSGWAHPLPRDGALTCNICTQMARPRATSAPGRQPELQLCMGTAGSGDRVRLRPSRPARGACEALPGRPPHRARVRCGEKETAVLTASVPSSSQGSIKVEN